MYTIGQIGHLEIVSDEFLISKKPEISAFAKSETVAKLAERIESRVILVLGGDGTMLRAIRERYAENISFLGVNFGTKGFLLNRVEDLQEAEGFERFPYPLLEITSKTKNWYDRNIAFNEAQIKTAGGHMVTLDVSIGEHSAIALKGDGVLVVTPAGTTGYNASAGWPILPHPSELFVITPLLSFEPKRAASTVFENHESVRIFHASDRWQTLSVFADSTPVIESFSGPMEVVVRKYQQAVSIIVPRNAVVPWKRRIFEEQWFKPPLPCVPFSTEEPLILPISATKQ